MTPSRKRHGMSKRTQKMKRQARGMRIMADMDAANVKKFFLPNG
jgi:large subunit ribosomal protein L35